MQLLKVIRGENLETLHDLITIQETKIMKCYLSMQPSSHYLSLEDLRSWLPVGY